MSAIVPVDTTSELAVTSYLQQARDWLTRAVDETGPEQIAAAKAEIATAAEATKQLGLSEEIRSDAVEMVRRAQYALGKAVRKGQADGTIAAREDNLTRSPFRRGTAAHPPSSEKPTSADFFSGKEERGDAYAMAAVADFDEVIAEARAEGNLSRANVARIAREKSGRSHPAPADDVRRTADAETFNALMAFVRRAVTPDRTATLKPRAREALIRTFQTAIEVLDQKEQS